MLENVRVGLALGGGAARGLAHIGVLHELEKVKIPLHIVTGTSIGALVGAVFATSASVREVEERFAAFLHSREFRRAEFDFLKQSKVEKPGVLYNVSNLIKRGIFFTVQMTRTSFVSAENFRHNIHKLLPEMPIEQTKIQMVPVATDLNTCEEVLLTKGPLRQVVMASCAIPGILPPVDYGGRRFIDGGWVSKIPVLAAFREGADVVIAVDVSDDIGDASGLKTGMDVMARGNAIKSEALKRFQLRFADAVIAPDVRNHHWADFASALPLIQRGRDAARAMMPKIQRAVDRGRLSAIFGMTRGRKLARHFF